MSEQYKREVMRMLEKLEDNHKLWQIIYTVLVNLG